jgi:hypothetical protein
VKVNRYLLSNCIFATLALAQRGFGQDVKPQAPPIQDNSFLIEEAYNQETGVVQHISTFTRMWNSKDWNYTFTQEWPGMRNWRHQLSYTVAGLHTGNVAASGAGLGDTILNYRYQAIGSGDARLSFSPRLSIMLPTGKVEQGRGSGGVGVQTNLPVSVVLHPRLVTHWNLGGTFIPHAQNADHQLARSLGYNMGQSLIAIVHPRVNLMLETCAGAFQSVVGRATTAWSRTLYTSPGVRWAFNLKSGLQIVPGVAVPLGIGPSAGERGLFLYLSLEHPFRRMER